MFIIIENLPSALRMRLKYRDYVCYTVEEGFAPLREEMDLCKGSKLFMVWEVMGDVI
jgi:hypothetical protein